MKNGEIKADRKFKETRPRADKEKKKKNQYLWCVRCREISCGVGGGILRYPSPSTDRGVGRPPAGIPDDTQLPIALWRDIRRGGGGILRYPSPSTDRGVGRPPAGIFDKNSYCGGLQPRLQGFTGRMICFFTEVLLLF